METAGMRYSPAGLKEARKVVWFPVGKVWKPQTQSDEEQKGALCTLTEKVD
jgi:hypothetical protein